MRKPPPGRASSSAVSAFQATSFSGSVKYGNTSDGAAAIRTSLMISPASTDISAPDVAHRPRPNA